MVTNAEEPAQPAGNRERVADAAEVVADAARTVIAGSPTARARRGVLFILAALGLVVPELAPASLVGLVLLAWTDNVVDIND